MKTTLKSLLFIGLLGLATSASAIEIKSWFTLSDTTAKRDPICLSGCTGSIIVDLDQAAYGGVVPNRFLITDIRIQLDSPQPLLFTSILSPLSTATVVDGKVESIDFALATSDNHFLSFNAGANGTGDWNIGGLKVNSGGSGVRIPEPTSIALLGIGLLGLGLAGKRKSKNSAV